MSPNLAALVVAGLSAFAPLQAADAQTLSLAQAQTLLMTQAPELRLEKTAGEKSRAQLSEVWSAFYPSLDVYGSYQAFSKASHISVDPPGPSVIDQDIGDKTREEYGVDLTYPLYAGGQRRGQLLSKKAAIKASDETVRARQNQLSLRLVSLYFAWHIAEAARVTQASLVKAHEDSWNRIASEVRQGSALKSREASARARWLNAQVDLQGAVDVRDSLARAAALLLGLPPGQPLGFTWDSAAATAPSAGPAPSPGSRAEIQALDQTSESLNQQERALFGQKLPSLSALAGYRLANPGLNQGADEYMHYGLIGLQLKWNLFDGFRNRAQRLQIRSQREAVDVERERQTGLWSEAALSADRYAARLDLSLKAAQASLEAAQEGLQEKTAQRKQGAASELDLIDATVLEAKAALQVRQLVLQGMLAQWQQRFARGETLVFGKGE